MEIFQHYDSNSIYILDYADCFRDSARADYHGAHEKYEKMFQNIMSHTRIHILIRTCLVGIARAREKGDRVVRCNIIVDILAHH